ncbi:GDSL-LIKE LIPASE/ACYLHYDROLASE-RELATED [Salix viminalis]|uniref:GDSL-LIKE LIPASE/ACYLHYDROLASE-RELATED n=1 Tax=Salix viminalis TaxID=40686 RepID=A0A9Q0QJK9_SALVM|nr:GDSL-LIKE LIPASE/ACYLHYDROLASE-RELATED [Salix viminalis]
MGFTVLCIIFVGLLHFISQVGGAPLAPALYVFGDSLFDSGNNNLLPTVSRADFKPYGVNFVKGDTGRFSNGRLVPDFIAEFLGLPYPPPSISIRTSTPLTGLNYASASCGILPETGQYLGKCLSLDDQIDLFQRTVRSSLPKHFKSSPDEQLEYLSKSIFVVCIGSNDYMSNYLEPRIYGTSKHFSPQAFANHLLDKLSGQFRRLYNLGARKVVMYEIGPIGCIPSMTRKNKHDGKCVEESNQLVAYFNENLLGMLQNLTSTLPNSIFVRGHAHWLGYDAIMNPSKYGLLDTSNPCCITWANGTSACIPELKPCPDPNHHYFFDGYHLTETVYSVLARACIDDKSVCSPTLKDLVQL